MTLYVEDFISNHKQEYELLNLKYNLLKEDVYNSIKINLDKQLVNGSCPFSLNFDFKTTKDYDDFTSSNILYPIFPGIKRYVYLGFQYSHNFVILIPYIYDNRLVVFLNNYIILHGSFFYENYDKLQFIPCKFHNSFYTKFEYKSKVGKEKRDYILNFDSNYEFKLRDKRIIKHQIKYFLKYGAKYDY